MYAVQSTGRREAYAYGSYTRSVSRQNEQDRSSEQKASQNQNQLNGQKISQDQDQLNGQKINRNQDPSNEQKIIRQKEQSQEQQSGQEGREAKTAQDRLEEAREQLEKWRDWVAEMQAQAQAIKDAFDPSKRKNLYDATSDLMAIANAEREPALKAIYTRLLLEARLMKTSGADSDEVRSALTKIKKVIGKVKTKIKKLKKEAQLEKKAENARKAKQRRLEEAVRREVALRRKVRKERERRDVEESRMGMGANYGGPKGVNSAGKMSSAYSTGSVSVADDIMIEASVRSELGDDILSEAAMMTGSVMTDAAMAGISMTEGAVAADVGGAVAGGSIDIAL